MLSRVVWVLFFVFVFGYGAFSVFTTKPIAINPTGSPIRFEIDNVAYVVEANTGSEIDITHGEHTITMSWQTMWTFDFGWFDSDSVINPTMSEFVVVDVLYGEEKYESKLTNSTIIVKWNPYTGPYHLISKSAYIKKDWDYGAYEASPESVTTKSDYVIKKELFMVDDFVEAYYHDNEERVETEGDVSEEE